MNNLTLIIYLIGVVDGIKAFFGVGVGVFGIMLLLLFIQHIIAYCEDNVKIENNKVYNYLKTIKIYIFIVFFISAVMGTLVPSSTTLTSMYLVPKIANNKKLMGVSNKSIDLLDLKLNQWISIQKDKLTLENKE